MSFGDLLTVADVAVRAHLGDAVTYTPTVGSPVEVTGPFDRVYVKVDAQQAGISSSGPAVWLSLDDLPSDPAVDTAATVTIGGTVYRPHTYEPDGKGGILLLLHEVT